MLKQMPSNAGVNNLNGLQRVTLSEPGGSSVQVLLCCGRIISWKNDRGEELLFTQSSKSTCTSLAAVLGGISICFPQVTTSGQLEQQECGTDRLWTIDNNAYNNPTPKGNKSSVNLILKPLEQELKTWPYRFELRLSISISPGRLILIPSVRNAGNKSFSFSFSIRNYLSISDISEVRIEGLETLEYLDNTLHNERFTEQADALTFDGEVNRTYLNTPSSIAIIDHEKKRTFLLHKKGLPDAVVRNPWNKPGKSFVPYLGDDHKTILSVDSAVIEKPVVLKPF